MTLSRRQFLLTATAAAISPAISTPTAPEVTVAVDLAAGEGVTTAYLVRRWSASLFLEVATAAWADRMAT